METEGKANSLMLLIWLKLKRENILDAPVNVITPFLTAIF